MTLILGPLEDLVSDKKLPGVYRQRIHLIHKSALRLLNLINQVLDFRKTETQNRKLTVSRGNLSDVVMEDALHKESEEKVLVQEAQDVEPMKDGRPLLLIVEDNADIKDYIVTSFSGNYRIQTASDGKEGWDMVVSLIPDLVISDVMMPVMDGIELWERIKKDVRTSHVLVILLTAKDSLHDKQEGYDSGADSYLTKPFTARLLASRVRNLLDSRNQLVKRIMERMSHVHSEQPLLTELGTLDEAFLQHFAEILEANLASGKVDMAFMAGQMHMSHSTLYRKVKALTGMSGNEFIRKIKLRHSLRLLLEGGYNVSEAAYASGFNDLGYFRSCFKEEYGQSPTEYLKQK